MRRRAYEERARIPADVALDPHTLSRDEVHRLRRLVYLFPEIKRAYLVRRRLEALRQVPAHLLIVDLGFWSTGENVGPIIDRIAQQATVADGDLTVAWAGLRGLGRKAKRIRGAQFYEKLG